MVVRKFIRLLETNIDHSCFTTEQYEEAMWDCLAQLLAEGNLRETHKFFLGQAFYAYGRYIECCKDEGREIKQWPRFGLTYTPRDD